MTDPDPRTASDDVEDPISNEGVSAPDPAEGADDIPAGDEDSASG
jgi:hypothetical protein